MFRAWCAWCLSLLGSRRAVWVSDAADARDSSACPSDREPHVGASERRAACGPTVAEGYGRTLASESLDDPAKSRIVRGQIPLVSKVVGQAPDRLPPSPPRGSDERRDAWSAKNRSLHDGSGGG